jgi:amino acid transporter
MNSRKPAIAISFFIVAIGIAWLLNAMHVVPNLDWIWIIGLGVSGILLLTITRLDRFNFVAGLSLIVSSVLAVLRQTGRITVNVEAPVLFITVGILLLVAQILPLPAASTLAEKPRTRDEPPKP